MSRSCHCASGRDCDFHHAAVQKGLVPLPNGQVRPHHERKRGALPTMIMVPNSNGDSLSTDELPQPGLSTEELSGNLTKAPAAGDKPRTTASDAPCCAVSPAAESAPAAEDSFANACTSTGTSSNEPATVVATETPAANAPGTEQAVKDRVDETLLQNAGQAVLAAIKLADNVPQSRVDLCRIAQQNDLFALRCGGSLAYQYRRNKFIC